MNAEREGSVRLSPTAAARREAMLGTLLAEMCALHRRRRRRRRALAAGGGALALIVAAVAARRPAGPDAAPPPRRIVADVRHVETDPGVLARCRPAATFRAEIIDDDALLMALAEAGRPAGLVRMDGRVRLTDPRSGLGPPG